VDIHFVCSFCLFSVTILQYLISLLRCAQTDRQTVDDDDGSVERKRVGGTETKFYQSSTSLYVTDERFFKQTASNIILPALLLYCIYLPDCKNIVHDSIRRESWWHSSIILLSLSSYTRWYLRTIAREKAEKDKCMYIWYAHVTVGLVHVELKISSFDSLQ